MLKAVIYQKLMKQNIQLLMVTLQKLIPQSMVKTCKEVNIPVIRTSHPEAKQRMRHQDHCTISKAHLINPTKPQPLDLGKVQIPLLGLQQWVEETRRSLQDIVTFVLETQTITKSHFNQKNSLLALSVVDQVNTVKL